LSIYTVNTIYGPGHATRDPNSLPSTGVAASPDPVLQVETDTAQHVVRANEAHPAAAPLRALLTAATTAPKTEPADRRVRRSLAAYGAPLHGEEPRASWPLVESVLGSPFRTS